MNVPDAQGARYKLTYDGMYHLDIPKTRQYDNGKVEVIARSSVGEARYETTLTVKPRKDDYRGVLKNSPRRKYTSPWGEGHWSTKNLLQPPDFIEFLVDPNKIEKSEINESDWLSRRKYLNRLVEKTEIATSKSRQKSRKDTTLYKSYLTLAQIEHKSMNTPNWSEISLNNSSIIEDTFSTIRHEQCNNAMHRVDQQQTKQSLNSMNATSIVQKPCYPLHTTRKLDMIDPRQNSFTIPNDPSILLVTNAAAIHDGYTTIKIRHIHENTMRHVVSRVLR